MMKQGASGRFLELDVLRGLAAACVVLSHYSSHCLEFFGSSPIHLPTKYGYHAVQLFFIISGFVIFYTLERCRNWQDFLFLRATRLYPTYWAVLALMTAVSVGVFGQSFWFGGLVVNITMFQEYLGFPNLDVVFWSLTVEIAFYGAMAFLLSRRLLAHIEWVTAFWLTAACLWTILDEGPGAALLFPLAKVLILEHIPFFVAGILFYRIHSEGLTASRIALLLGALVSHGYRAGWEDMGIAAILFGIFVLGQIGGLRFTVTPVTLWLGTISYPLYLSHRNLGYLSLDWLHAAGVPIPLAISAVLCASLLLATGLTFLVERPALRILRARYTKGRWHQLE